MAENNRESEHQEFKDLTIGKVKLNMSHYGGQDLYCDGAVEDELLAITRDLSPVEYPAVIRERASWPILYHLSGQRENIVEWLPMTKRDKVLEVGGGCGAITGALTRKAGEVVSVDLSQKRCKINAYRHSECENLTIHVGNFRDIEPDLDGDFDWICLIGVFEYGISYMGGDTPFEDFLKILQRHVKQGGRIVIAIENRLGLKYFAGCREDHLGTYFSGISNYVDGGGVRTFSRNGLEKIFQSCDAGEAHFYYPYPDYKFMTTLFSDRHLPGKGELSNNLRNFDRDRLMLFDEKNAFDGLSEDGLFPVFSNSYLVILGPDCSTEYVRYSNDRAPQFRIATEIVEEEGQRWVRKRPLTAEAGEHIRSMSWAWESLAERYRGSDLEIAPCELLEEDGEPAVQFPFVEGVTLTELLDRALDAGDEEEFCRLFGEYLRRIGYGSDREVTDFDLAFSNVLVQGDTWTVIDYEWTFGKAMEMEQIAFRAVYCYLLEDEKRERIPMDRLLDMMGITPQEAEELRAREADFQKYVNGDCLTMAQLRELVGGQVMDPRRLFEGYQDLDRIRRVQVYEDRGKGFSEENSYFVPEAYLDEKTVEITLEVSGDVRQLRIDPMMDSCVVKILEMTFNGQQLPVGKKRTLLVNGRSSGGEKPSIVFANEDPNIGIPLEPYSPKAQNFFFARMEVTQLPLNCARDLCDALARHIRI